MILMAVSKPSIGERISEILHLCLELFASVIEHGQVAIALDPFALKQPAETIHFALCLFEFNGGNIAERCQFLEALRLSSATLSASAEGKGSSARCVAARRSARACFNCRAVVSSAIVASKSPLSTLFPIAPRPAERAPPS